MQRKEDFSESSVEAMLQARSTSLTAQVGLEEYDYLRGKGIAPRVLHSKSLGFRVLGEPAYPAKRIDPMGNNSKSAE